MSEPDATSRAHLPPSMAARSEDASAARSDRPTGARRHWRRPRRTALLGAAGGLVLIAATAATTLILTGQERTAPQPAAPSYGFTDTGVPDAEGASAVEPLRDALTWFFDEHGHYPHDVEELIADGVLARNEQLTYRLEVNADASAYVAGAVGQVGDYAALTSAGGQGEGATFAEALEDAGWTVAWAADEGFEPMPAQSRAYGVIDVAGNDVRELSAKPDEPGFSLIVHPVPTVAAGASWQDAVRAAGGTPEGFPFGELRVGEPSTAEADDGAVAVVALLDDGTYLARLEPPASLRTTGQDPLPLLEAAGLAELGDRAQGRYTCATATDGHGIHQVTVCANSLGGHLAWATTGHAASGPGIYDAMEAAGATPAWLDEHGIPQPDLADLF